MSTTTSLLESAALAAYADPIEAHAREWAEGVCDSIECDVQHRASPSFNAGLADVTAEGEWESARVDLYNTGLRALQPWRIPEGAKPWATRVWIKAFKAELIKCVEARTERSVSTIRRHLREAGARS